jgi:hypothetical protein
MTSQFWANGYLDSLDHFFRDELGVPGYMVRGRPSDLLALLGLTLNQRKCRI